MNILNHYQQKFKGIFTLERLILCIIAYGVLCRIRLYLTNRSLWVDEAKYAIKTIHLSYFELLFPLKSAVVSLDDKLQVGPIGFFYLSKFFTDMFGDSEYILRLIPLLSGLVSLYLIYVLARRFLKPLGVMTAVGLFSLSRILIVRSADYHPYVSDVLVTILLYLMVEQLRVQPLNKKRVLYTCLAGAVAVAISLPVAFTLTALAVCLVISALYEQKFDRLKPLMLIGLFWAACIILNYFGYLRTFYNSELYGPTWQEGGFMPYGLNWDWIYERFNDSFSVEPFRFKFWQLPALLYMLGCVSIFLNDKIRFLYLFLPIFIALVVAALQIYPFSGRVILYLVPLFVIFIAEGVDVLSNISQRIWKPLTYILLVCLFALPLIDSGKRLIRPIQREEIRPIIENLSELKEAEDALYVYQYAVPAMQYYGKRFGIKEDDYTMDDDAVHMTEGSFVNLDKLKGKSRVWVVYCHMNNIDGKLFLGYLDKIGKKKVEYTRPGAGLVLYDLS